MTIEQIGAFMAVSFLLLITPGPSVLYIMSRSLSGGYQGAIKSVLGLACGDILQVFAVALGIAVFIDLFPATFDILKWLGAFYLFYLAYQSLPKAQIEDKTSIENNSSKRYFFEALIVNALNPKTTLFFVSFLPAFLLPSQMPFIAQIITLGMVFVIIGIGTNGFYGAVCVLTGMRFQFVHSPYVQNWLPAATLSALGLGILIFR